MDAFLAQFSHRAKAVVGFVVAGVVTYIGDAITAGHPLTVHGLEVAAVAAVTTALGVHQIPNTPTPKAKPAEKA